MARHIPGYYYDEGKKKYFKIMTNGSVDSKHHYSSFHLKAWEKQESDKTDLEGEILLNNHRLKPSSLPCLLKQRSRQLPVWSHVLQFQSALQQSHYTPFNDVSMDLATSSSDNHILATHVDGKQLIFKNEGCLYAMHQSIGRDVETKLVLSFQSSINAVAYFNTSTHLSQPFVYGIQHAESGSTSPFASNFDFGFNQHQYVRNFLDISQILHIPSTNQFACARKDGLYSFAMESTNISRSHALLASDILCLASWNTHLLLAGTRDGTIYIADRRSKSKCVIADRGKRRKIWHDTWSERKDRAYLRHEDGSVKSLFTMSDGVSIISAGTEGELRLWDLRMFNHHVTCNTKPEAMEDHAAYYVSVKPGGPPRAARPPYTVSLPAAKTCIQSHQKSIALTPCQDRLFAVGSDGYIRTYTTTNLEYKGLVMQSTTKSNDAQSPNQNDGIPFSERGPNTTSRTNSNIRLEAVRCDAGASIAVGEKTNGTGIWLCTGDINGRKLWV